MFRVENICVVIRSAGVAGIASILLLGLSGCALIPLATVGAVVDIAGTAASAGPAVYKAGKLDIAFVNHLDDVHAAVRAAAADLDLRITTDKLQDKTGNLWVFELEDNQKTNVEVIIERRTRTLCRCRVDVGLFGSEPTARLLMSRIEKHLPPPPATQPGCDS